MPLMLIPIIAGGVVGGATGASIGGIMDAHSTNKSATRIDDEAQILVNQSNELRENYSRLVEDHLSQLGHKKADVLNQTLSAFVEAFREIRNISPEETTISTELSTFVFEAQSEYKRIELNNKPFSFIGAKSLGWLLATGVVGLGIYAISTNAKAKTNYDNARSNLAIAKAYAEETKTVKSMCLAIIERTDMYHELIIFMEKVVENFTIELTEIYRNYGTDFQRFPEAAKKKSAMALSAAKATKALLNVDLLDEQGKLTEESFRVLEAQTKAYKTTGGGLNVEGSRSPKVTIKV